MPRHLATALAVLPLLTAVPAPAQQPLYPSAVPRTVEPEALPSPAPVIGDAPSRVFCGQPVSFRLADPAAVAERYRPFIGIWSDAAWTPSLCAALIVANVTQDGTATILYAFGPQGSTGRAGGILNGTGIIRDGELRFQNSDGSQFAFRPLYADMSGRLITPTGQRYEAVFKKTL